MSVVKETKEHIIVYGELPIEEEIELQEYLSLMEFFAESAEGEEE